MSIKEIFELIKKYYSLIWDKKLWIILCSLIVGLLLGVRAKLQPDIYNAKLSFMVNEDEGGVNSIGTILGQFGFGGGNSGKNYEKIMDIARSNKLLKQVLMEKATLQGQNDYIGNYIIQLYEYHEYWEEDSLIRDFVYTSTNGSSKAAIVATKKLVSLLRGDPKDPDSNPLLSIEYDDESTILEIHGVTESPDLSIELAKVWYEKVLTFYVKNSTERQQKTLNELTIKSDSIYNLLVGSETGLARGSDKMGLIKAIDNLPTAQQSRNMQMYSAMYAEVIKNKETTEFILKSQTPYFQAIDIPLMPLKKVNKRGWFMWSIIGCIAGGIMGIGLIVGYDYINEELNA
jgi:uncharacterized protein involved in exopolysaccharide biosynthesis